MVPVLKPLLTTRGNSILLLLATCLALLGSPQARAAYPDGPVEIIHAYPGVPTEVALRYLADKLSVMWKQPVVVEARPGASEIIAGDAVAKSAPDGYTLFAGADSNFVNNQFLFLKLPFDPQQDLVPVTQLWDIPLALVVRGNLPAQNLAEFTALLKKDGSFKYGSTGVGTQLHLSMETMRHALGVEMLHVPYKVSSQLFQDLLGGRIDGLVGGVLVVAPQVPTGKLRALAISGERRMKALPDTPTFAEAGRPDIDLRAFIGLAVAKGTPPAVVEKIQADVRAVLASKEFLQDIFEPMGYLPVASTPRQFNEFLATRRVQVQTLIKVLGLKAE